MSRYPLSFADLPEPMRPWVVPKVYGDGPPRSGHWRQNQFVTARPLPGNATTQPAAMGWLCVQGGEPGSWATIAPQHTEGLPAKSDDESAHVDLIGVLNVCGLLVHAHGCNAHQLMEMCRLYIVSMRDLVTATEDWRALPDHIKQMVG